jgi:hypothetical protein
VAFLVLGLGGKGEPFYSQIAVEVPIFWMIVEAFARSKHSAAFALMLRFSS